MMHTRLSCCPVHLCCLACSVSLYGQVRREVGKRVALPPRDLVESRGLFPVGVALDFVYCQKPATLFRLLHRVASVAWKPRTKA
jgi:hypothetical protein